MRWGRGDGGGEMIELGHARFEKGKKRKGREEKGEGEGGKNKVLRCMRDEIEWRVL